MVCVKFSLRGGGGDRESGPVLNLTHGMPDPPSRTLQIRREIALCRWNWLQAPPEFDKKMRLLPRMAIEEVQCQLRPKENCSVTLLVLVRLSKSNSTLETDVNDYLRRPEGQGGMPAARRRREQ